MDTPTHDRNGNMLRIMKPDDPESYYTLTWDAWNRLVKVEDGATPIANYTYDGRNFRIKKLVSGTTRRFYYNRRWQCLEERLDASANADRHFLWGLRYIDDLILRDRDTSDPKNGALDERLYAVQDANWNAVGVASTDSGIRERYAYSAYGTRDVLTAAHTPRPNSDHGWEYAFTGRLLDSEVGLGYFRARYYATHLGRFGSQDPVGRTSAGVNLYQYAGNSSPNYLEPLGLWKVSRLRQTKAFAVAEDNDTIESLAEYIGLNAAEWR